MQLFKNIKAFAPYILPVAISLSLTSCLKDNNPPPLANPPVPELVSFQDNGGDDASGAGYGTTTTPYPLYNFNLTLYNDTAGFAAIVIYGPKGPAPSDIKVSLALDTAGLNAFNLANSTSYTVPDLSTFNIPASVTIPAGQSQAFARITITSNSALDPNASNCIPIMITAVSSGSYSSNFSHEINSFSVQ
jgi:hypothetical protein